MKKIDIPVSMIISIFLAIISLYLFLHNSMEIISYKYPMGLLQLSEKNVEIDKYVKGTISDCFTVFIDEYTEKKMGSCLGRIKAGKVYECYTIPVADGNYIRAFIADNVKGMEDIVDGKEANVYFTGQVKKADSLDDSHFDSFYDRDPHFDKNKVVMEYVLWEKTIELEKNLCIAGLYGMVIAVLIYLKCGGVRVVENKSKSTKNMNIAYDKEYELLASKMRVQAYEQREKQYRKEGIVGMLIVVISLFGIFKTNLGLMGIIVLVYGVKTWWKSFINSNNKYAMGIARFFDIDTLQTKLETQKCRIELIEAEIGKESDTKL